MTNNKLLYGRLALLFAALLLCVGATAQQVPNVMVVGSGGESLRLYIDEVESITFAGSDMVVQPLRGSAQRFDRGAIADMTFLYDGHDAVDLGLTVRWATCNVGADSPEAYGQLFAWGETAAKVDCQESTYRYYADNAYQHIGTNICGNTQYDVARRMWRGAWRLPTRAEVAELTSRCQWTAETLNGVAGYRVTGPTGNSIFLPAAGYKNGRTRSEAGTGGFYWTGTLNRDMPSTAYNLNFRGYDDEWTACRAYGFAVRPVR